jgi:hypothetical protein
MLEKGGEKPRAFIDLIDTLVRWEDPIDCAQYSKGIKEIYCGCTQSGEELIRFASTINNPQNLINELKKNYEVFLISSNPKIYTNALNEEFRLGFRIQELISAEEYLSTEGLGDFTGYNNQTYQEDCEDILVSSHPKNSTRSKKQRQYLGLRESNQIDPEEILAKTNKEKKEHLSSKRIKNLSIEQIEI